MVHDIQFLLKRRFKSGQNSRTTFIPAFAATLNAKLLAACDAPEALGGAQVCAMKDAPAALPMRANANIRSPLSRRARKVLITAYFVRFSNPVSPDRK